MTIVALSTGLRRGELLGLRWQDVELLEQRLHVRRSFVLGEFTSPKSRAGRRTIPLGPVAIEALEEQFTASSYRGADCVVFSHPALGTPLDPYLHARRTAFPDAAELAEARLFAAEEVN